MKDNIRVYLNALFAGAGADDAAEEFKQELLADLFDRYDELIEEGKTEAEAYRRVIEGLGAPDALLSELERRRGSASAPKDTPTPEGADKTARRRKKALCTSIAIALYILCPIPLIFLGMIGEQLAMVGLLCLFLFVAAATGLVIYSSIVYSDVKAERKEEYTSPEAVKGKKLRSAIESAFWLLVVAAYLGISFLSGSWGITWVIFLIAAAVQNIAEAVYDFIRAKQ